MQHKIKTIKFDLSVDRRLDVLALQQRVSDRFRMDIIPAMDRQLDANSDELNTLTIDTLEIDLGCLQEEMIDSGDWSRLFQEKLEAALLSCLSDRMAPGAGGKIPSFDHVFSQWRYYMEHGYLPWNAGRPDPVWLVQVLESLAVNFHSAEELRGLIVRNAAALRRMVLHHSPEFLSHLVELLTAEKQQELPAAIEQLAVWLIAIPAEQKPIVAKGAGQKDVMRKMWTAILHEVAVNSGAKRDTVFLIGYLLGVWMELPSETLSLLVRQHPFTAAQPFIQKIILGITIEPERSKPPRIKDDYSLKTPSGKAVKITGEQQAKPGPAGAAAQEAQEPIDAVQSDSQASGRRRKSEDTGREESQDEIRVSAGAGIYIAHVGLVLLHPFIHNFFKKLNLVQNGAFVDDVSQEHAVCLLHELTDSGTPIHEYDLLLAKLLCAWPLHKPVDTDIVFSEEERNEAQHLLQAVIEQWPRLKNTRPAALQTMFLQREGKLVYRNDQWHLYVEKKSIDVLLEYLPWNLSIMKLPWMRDVLRVEWY